MLITRPIAALAFAATVIVGPAAATSERVREQQAVTVGGVEETWRLVWTGRTRQICRPDEIEMAITCPCSGWAYGEAGDLALVRLRAGREVERLSLGRYFGDFDYPAGEVAAGEAYLQRWPLHDDDREGDPSAAIMRRPQVQAMRFADYDHDGHATEFLMQVGTLPCGKRQYVALGVSAANPRLHALGSAAHPDKPLVLPAQAWAALETAAQPGAVDAWQCGDHGSERHTDVVLSTEPGRIRVLARSFSCPEDGSAEKLLGSEAW